MSKTLTLIPAYNCEGSIAMSLESCISQTIPTETIVVDNCSTDKTPDIVKQYIEEHPNIKLMVNEKNLGRIGNFNRCLEIFKENHHQYVMFLFTGDTLKPHCIEEVEKAFEKYPDVGAVFWTFEFQKDGVVSIAKELNESRYLSPAEINEANINNKKGHLGAIVSNIYAKKAVVESGAYFNEAFIGKADFDFRILQNSGAYYLDKVLSTFNAEHHRTFPYTINNHRMNIEFSFNRACALERIRNKLSPKQYERFRSNVILGTLRENIHLLKWRDLPAISKIILLFRYKRIKGILGKIKRHVEKNWKKS